MVIIGIMGATLDINVKTVKAGNVKKIGFLEIKIQRKVSSDHYIAGDVTDNILLVSEQNLREDSCYKLIKPYYEDKKLKQNPKFAAVKLQKNLDAVTLTDEKIKSFDAGLEAELVKDTSTKENNFEVVEALGVGGIAKEIKLMVVSKSGVIAGKFGSYKIATCKDIKNQKNSINLYRNLQNLVEVGGIYNFINLKVSNFKKDDDKYLRLGTLSTSRVVTASASDRKKFQDARILVGDASAKGTIVGISELNVYESCEICWCKLDDEGFCRKCNKNVDKKKKDFNLVMYIEVEEQHEKDAEKVDGEDDDVEDILSVFCFSSTLALEHLETMEINEDSLNAKLMGKKCYIEYNLDQDSDGKDLKLVMFMMN